MVKLSRKVVMQNYHTGLAQMILAITSNEG